MEGRAMTRRVVALRISLGFMSIGAIGRARASVLVLATLCIATITTCSDRGFFREYEYQEDLYLSLDGSVRVSVYASVASLVALRGADLDPDPEARPDRAALRSFFGGEPMRAAVSLSRRNGRRFVSVSVRADRLALLSSLAPFAWSSYHFERTGDVVRYRQRVGAPTSNPRREVQWMGGEVVAFRMHVPSEIVFHNAPSGQVRRGNILEWEQSLEDRLAGRPLDMQVEMEPESILHTTLVLFGLTAAAALGTLGLVVWWIARRGKDGVSPDA
jgi:hypothetical protein